jgi:hypothetical protein
METCGVCEGTGLLMGMDCPLCDGETDDEWHLVEMSPVVENKLASDGPALQASDDAQTFGRAHSPSRPIVAVVVERDGAFCSTFHPVEPGCAWARSVNYVKHCGRHCRESYSTLAQEKFNQAPTNLSNDDKDIYAYTLGGNSERRLQVEVDIGISCDDAQLLYEHGRYVFFLRRAFLRRIRSGMNVSSGIVHHCASCSPDVLAKLRPGFKFLWPAFLSTSKKQLLGIGQVTFNIDLAGNGLTYAIDISDTSAHQGEGEVLIYPYSGFEVTRSETVGDQVVVSLRTCDTLYIDKGFGMDEYDMSNLFEDVNDLFAHDVFDERLRSVQVPRAV